MSKQPLYPHIPASKIEGYQTAIARNRPPEPTAYLKERGLLLGRILDYGSGRNSWPGIESFDPYYWPKRPSGNFDTIICNYVLNVVSESTEKEILDDINTLLKPTGKAYITVRRDIPQTGIKGRGTFQRYVILSLNSISKTSTREIYVMAGRGNE